MKRKIYFLFTIFFVSCGIPQFVYLEEPAMHTLANLFTCHAVFLNSTKNDPDHFFGFDLYYQLYPTKGQLDTAIRQINGTTVNGRNYLKRKGYHKLFIADNSGTTPDTQIKSHGYTIPIKNNKRKPLEISIDFIDDQVENLQKFNSYVLVEYITEKIYICRNPMQNRVNKNDTDYLVKSFAPDNFSIHDSDIVKGKLEGNRLYMALYVCAVGYNKNYVPIYSKPTYLGKCEFIIDEGVFND